MIGDVQIVVLEVADVLALMVVMVLVQVPVMVAVRVLACVVVLIVVPARAVALVVVAVLEAVLIVQEVCISNDGYKGQRRTLAKTYCKINYLHSYEGLSVGM